MSKPNTRAAAASQAAPAPAITEDAIIRRFTHPARSAEDNIRFFHSRPVSIKRAKELGDKMMNKIRTRVPNPPPKPAPVRRAEDVDSEDGREKRKAATSRKTENSYKAAQESTKEDAVKIRHKADARERADRKASKADKGQLDKFVIRPGPIFNTFTLKGHYRKLMLQRNLLRFFARKRELTNIEAE